jgi:hypothetical protein
VAGARGSSVRSFTINTSCGCRNSAAAYELPSAVDGGRVVSDRGRFSRAPSLAVR